VAGDKYSVKDEQWSDVKGNYSLSINSANGVQNYTIDVKNANTANVIGKDTLIGKFSFDGKLVKLSFSPLPSKNHKQMLVPLNKDLVPEGFQEAAEIWPCID